MRIKREDLPRGENSGIFHTVPSLHRHASEEVLFVEEGDLLFTVGGEPIEAGPGDIVVVPPGTPHRFVSRGETHRGFGIHPVPRMETEWLE